MAGFYALTHRILKLPTMLVGQNVGHVFLERASRARGNKSELKRITQSLYVRLLVLGALVLSVVTFYGDLLFPFVFGDEWAEAGRYAQWLSVWLILEFGVVPLGMLFTVLEKQGEVSIWNAGLLISRVVVLVVAPLLVDDTLTVIAVYAVVGAAYWFVRSLRTLSLAGARITHAIVKIAAIVGGILLVQYLLSLLVRRLFA